MFTKMASSRGMDIDSASERTDERASRRRAITFSVCFDLQE